MNKIASLTLALSALGTSAHASEASFNEAVNLYLKGYADCREANTLRTDDIKAARKYFDNYLKILDQAAALDPAILKTTERDMDANLTYCERVNNNLKMAEAAPVLEAGFTDCEAAKTAMASNDFGAAQQALDAYTIKRDEALAITPSIMEVFSLASQVRACGRLEEKLAEAQKASAVEAQAIADLQQQLNQYQQKCQNALSYTRKNTFTIDTIDQANRLLAEAQQARKQANNNVAAHKALKADESKAAALKQQEDAAGRCEVEVSGLIRNMTKQRQLAEASLEDAISLLGKAGDQCRQGRQLLTQNNDARGEASRISKQIGTLVGEATTPTLTSLAKRHPDWSQSKAWQQQNTQVAQCQQQLQAALTSSVKTAPVKAMSASSAGASPATPAVPTLQKLTEQTAPAQSAPTSKTAQAPTGETSPSQAAIESLPTEAPAAGAGTSVTTDGAASVRPSNGDWTELANEPNEQEEAPATNKKPLRKSWTDLVK